MPFKANSDRLYHIRKQKDRITNLWFNVALRMPDDGTGALPLLRHVLLNDPKSAAYKLGLLRALCRTLARPVSDGPRRARLVAPVSASLRESLP